MINSLSQRILNNRNTLLLIGVVIFALFPLLSEKTKGFPVILFSIISLAIFLSEKKRKIDFKFLFVNSSLFTINILSVIYSLSFVFPLKQIETSLSLLIIPLGFSILSSFNLDFNRKIRKVFINTFIFSSTLLAIILLFYYSKLGLFEDSTLKVNSFRNASTSIFFFQDHPIYLSIYFGLSILFITYYLAFFSGNARKLNILYLASLVILSINLILLSSKGVLVTTFLSVIFYLFYVLKGMIKYYLIISLILFFVSLILFSPTVERRFRELTIPTTYTKFHTTNSSSLRVAIYKCVINEIRESPIVGYGWGKTKETLKNCYSEKRNFLSQGNYNSHNQYFGYVLNGGIFGLAVLFYFMIMSFFKSIKNKDLIFSSVILFFGLIMLFENILERQSGLILFIFLLCFLKVFKKEKIQRHS